MEEKKRQKKRVQRQVGGGGCMYNGSTTLNRMVKKGLNAFSVKTYKPCGHLEEGFRKRDQQLKYPVFFTDKMESHLQVLTTGI